MGWVTVKDPVITAFPVYGKTEPPAVETVIIFPLESTARLAVAVPAKDDAPVYAGNCIWRVCKFH